MFTKLKAAWFRWLRKRQHHKRVMNTVMNADKDMAAHIASGSMEASCGRACGYEAPYGWVPESDCPIHDADWPEVIE